MLKDSLGLEGKAAIVTGGGSEGEGIGNGRAAAILLARAGARVLVVDRFLELAQNTAEMILADGGEAVVHEADLAVEEQCRGVVETAMAQFGRLDVLDNNVGVSSKGTVVDESQEDWAKVMRINVESVFLTSKYAIPAMIESGDGGAIVNIASTAAIRPRGMTAYSTSKGATMSLTRAMAVDHGVDGIRVNCILPGPIHTPRLFAKGITDEARERRRKSSLLEIEGEGWDIGNTVVYLCSNWARYVTGQCLVVDGGMNLTTRPRGSGVEDRRGGALA
jgi:NAD(P)-dependent dehydrogenase (short-subunit alcohol dehydrogenase family)